MRKGSKFNQWMLDGFLHTAQLVCGWWFLSSNPQYEKTAGRKRRTFTPELADFCYYLTRVSTIITLQVKEARLRTDLSKFIALSGANDKYVTWLEWNQLLKHSKEFLIPNVEQHHPYFVSAELQVILTPPSCLSAAAAHTMCRTTGRSGALMRLNLILEFSLLPYKTAVFRTASHLVEIKHGRQDHYNWHRMINIYNPITIGRIELG